MGHLQNLLNEVDEILKSTNESQIQTPLVHHEKQENELTKALSQYFGYDYFREGQQEIIEAILDGENVFAVFPTGHGKSICFQLPALMLPGMTVVVSPLISLMKDQVDTLRTRGIDSVSLMNSTLAWEDYLNEVKRLRAGKIKLLYITPERLRSRRFLDLLNTVRISLFVVDEAHCISQWGHDFRPAYLSICDAIEMLYPRVIALFTATAPPDIREDILNVLNISKPKVIVQGIERPNLGLTVIESQDKEEKFALLEKSLISLKGNGIIYAGRRKDTEAIAEFLQERGYRADYYHAGRELNERKRIQDAFFDDSGNGLDIVAATNAFGMGIDKANIRYIIHWTMTGTLEEYCQEIGRAGRDGEDAECLLFYLHRDRELHEWFTKESTPDKLSLLKLLEALENLKGAGNYRLMSMEELEWRVNFKISKIHVGLTYLEKLGFLKRWHNVPSQLSVRFRTNPKDEKSAQSKLYEQLRERRVTDILSFCQDLELSPRWLMEQLDELQNDGHIQYWGKIDLMLIELLQDSELFATISEDQMGLGDYVKSKHGQIDKMVGYALSEGCRMKYIRNYFGEDVPEDYRCNTCDKCNPNDELF
ncbi:MAG: RecQ family ATP-dependent DNA helicase [Candidatus Poribacteria bacterium]|nr:RecQ family ATP-dependent DNA helicase [Candidatus Poribacteria bacterium]